MATLTIRNLDEDVKREIRKAAAERGVSMEQEVRDRLTAAFGRVRKSRPTAEEVLCKFGRKPRRAYDLRQVTDEMWQEGLK